MIPRRLKDLLPKSLYGRSMLIIVLPVAIMQIAVVWQFFDAHWETVTRRLSDGVAGDIAIILDLYERDPSEARLDALGPIAERTMNLSVALEPDAILPRSTRAAFFSVLDRVLRKALMKKLDHPFWFDTTRYPAYVDIRVQVEAGVLRVIVPRDRVFAATGHIFLIWLVGASTLLTAVSLIYIRNQAKPIERLAEAAERFGRGQDAPDFRPAGAREVRQAAHAFLEMRRRIQRHIEQRTTLLAGVSHDLRTPLTRLKLQIAMSPKSEALDAMAQDLADMEAVLNEYLDFAKGVGGEDPELTDVGALILRVAENAAREGREIALDLEPDIVLPARTAALRRCLENLVGNALAHGDQVAVALKRTTGAVLIDVDDDGPGINESDREEAFRPFSRLDEARTRNEKGVGLGLAIARDVARSHGGDVALSQSPMGGLRARVRLPT